MIQNTPWSSIQVVPSIGRQLFAERGVDATSVEEVASRANVSKPVVYEHFGGKETQLMAALGPDYYISAAAVAEALAQQSSETGRPPFR